MTSIHVRGMTIDSEGEGPPIVTLHGLGRTDLPPGRHIAIAGDAELDEGNIYEALLEGWKHDVRNLWWIIDYNRQSLDSVVPDRLFGRIEGLFRDMGWNVVTIKYGRKLEAAFAREGGEALRAWCAERLSDYKVPETIDLTAEPLPRNANGKVMKRQLREGWAAAQ